MKHSTLCFSVALWTALAMTPLDSSRAQDLFLKGGHLVDPATQTISRGNLLIVDGILVGRPDQPPKGFAGEIVDVSGKWVLPGLHDLHMKIVYHTEGRMPTIDRPTLEAAIRTSTQLGLRTVIHVGTWNDARVSIEAGATAITHVPEPGEMPDDLVKLMKERGTYSIPTLTVHGELSRMLADPKLLERPLLKELSTEAVRASYGNEEAMAVFERWLKKQKEGRKNRLGAVKKMADAGIPILTGTDAGNIGVFQGYSVHRELELMVEAGLTPWQALAASTTVAGKFFGKGYGLGKGDVASLLVLDASPIEDIRNTQRIHRVIHHGEVIDREGLL